MKTKELVIVALSICLLTISAQLKLQIYTVPFSLQFLMVMLLGLILPRKLGFLSILLYLVIGLFGLPVFASGGGILYVMKAGFGFLLGFLAIPFVCDWSSRWKGKQLSVAIRTGVLCWLCLYVIALPYYYFVATTILQLTLTLPAFFMMFCLVFLPGDCLVIFLALIVSKRISVVVR